MLLDQLIVFLNTEAPYGLPTINECKRYNTIKDLFGITNIEEFYAQAEKALAVFQDPKQTEVKIHVHKISKNTLLNGKRTTCSFIHITPQNSTHLEQGIYALSNVILGRGGFGKVKFAIRIDTPNMDKLCTIKIQTIIQRTAQFASLLARETEVGRKQGFFLHDVSRRTYVGRQEDQEKFYLVSEYAGIPLSQWLVLFTPSANKRMEIALQICQKVCQLHRVGYVHGDLKLSNILIDPRTDNITLADFGLSTPICDSDRPRQAGTWPYMPIFPEECMNYINKRSQKTNLNIFRALNLEEYTKRLSILNSIGLDTFALKRCLFMALCPEILKAFCGDKEHFSLLAETCQSELMPWINTTTPDSLNSTVRTPLTLFCYLLLYYNQIECPANLSLEKQEQLLAIYETHTTHNLLELKTPIQQILQPESLISLNMGPG